jgi:hypothetical protein
LPSPCSRLPEPGPEQAEPPAADAGKSAEKPVVYGSFKQDTVYSLLVAELAGQRNRFDIALANYVDQAEKPRTLGFPNAPTASPNTSAPTSRPWTPR